MLSDLYAVPPHADVCGLHLIFRAMLRNPSLILCDEVTSSVDAFAEREIIDTLRSATSQRTTLTVAHRLSSVIHCDSIIVLDKGHIVESGTHLQLLELGETYRRMWDAQNNLLTTEKLLDGSSSCNGGDVGGYDLINFPVEIYCQNEEECLFQDYVKWRTIRNKRYRVQDLSSLLIDDSRGDRAQLPPEFDQYFEHLSQ
jgi:ABC-type multidrug transport system ATPase subunit